MDLLQSLAFVSIVVVIVRVMLFVVFFLVTVMVIVVLFFRAVVMFVLVSVVVLEVVGKVDVFVKMKVMRYFTRICVNFLHGSRLEEGNRVSAAGEILFREGQNFGN